MKLLTLIAAATLMSGPASAFVHTIDLTLDGASWDYTLNQYTTPVVPLSVTGWFETDVETGTVTAADTTAWEMTASWAGGSATFSSQGVFGTPYFHGALEVGGGDVTVPSGGVFKFGEDYVGFLNDGTEYLYVSAYVAVYDTTGTPKGSAVYYELINRCDTQWDSSTCRVRTSGYGLYAEDAFGTNVVGVADAGGQVPLPAGLPLILTGIGAIGLVARGRRRG